MITTTENRKTASVKYLTKKIIGQKKKVRRRSFKSDLANHGQLYLMEAPFLLLFLLFTILPILASFGLSFTYFNMLEAPRWRGLLNYQRMFTDDSVFLIGLQKTLLFAFITGPLSYLACFIFAWTINELPPVPRAAVTLVFYAPSIAGGAVIQIWQLIFNGDAHGFLNALLISWGFLSEPIQWLTDANYNLPLLMFVQLWLSLGTSFLAFIGGLQSIDRSLYEAAAIDGVKNRWQELWYVTLPSMKSFLLFGAVMQIAMSFQASSLMMQLAGFPSASYSARTIVTHIFDYGAVRYEMGYASAIAFFLFVVMYVTKILFDKLLKGIGR